jgi:hypothetical protein
MTLRRLRDLMLCLGLLTGTSGSCCAAIIVSIGSVSLTAGGASGFVDVTAAWTPGPGPGPATVNVQLMSNQFLISPVTVAPGSDVKFVEYPDGDNGDHQYGDANYLFAGVSANMFPNPDDHAGFVFGGGHEFAGGDGVHDPLNAMPPYVELGALPRLLYRFELFATGLAAGTEEFELLLDESSDSFFDDNGDPISFSSNSGSIFVSGGSTVVPEPATGGILAAAAVAYAIRRRRRTVDVQQQPE